jgi:PAS domain S-box-containing protein
MLFNWFAENLGLVFFIYGMTYIIIATAILGHNKKENEYGLAGVLWLFAAYALLHAPGDFIEMWHAISGKMDQGLKLTGILMTYLSYLFLFEFGRRVLKVTYTDSKLLPRYLLIAVMTVVMSAAAFSDDFWKNLDVFVGYILRFPGGIMAGVGMILYYENLPDSMKIIRIRKYFYLCGIALVLWAVFCGLIREKGSFFLSTLVNLESFFQFTNVPVYIFRSICGLAAAWSIIGMLNFFNHEKQIRLRTALDGESKTRSYLSRVIASIIDPLVVTDSEGRIAMMNRALVSMIGREESALMGVHIKSIINADDWVGMILPALISRETFEGEVQLVKMSGELIPTVYSITPIIDERDGSIDGFIGIAKEISIRKRIEAALNSRVLREFTTARDTDFRDSSNDTFRVENIKRNIADLALLDSYQFLQSIIDSVEDEVIVRSRQNSVEMMNYAARKRMRDHGMDTVRCVNVFNGGSYPCDDCGTGNLVNVVEENRGAIFFERYFTHGERSRVFEVSASPLHGENGTIIGIVEVSRDVTGRREAERSLRESEEKYRLLVESMDNGFVVLDRDLRIVFANRCFSAMVGPRPDELMGADLGAILTGMSGKKLELKSLLTRDTGKCVFEGEVKKSDSGILQVLVSANAIMDDNEYPIKHNLMVSDVTERRALERDVLKIYETERHRIGQDLHDDLMQNLIGIDVLIKMVMNSLKQKKSAIDNLDEESARLKEVTHFLEHAVSKSRRLARGLCPVDMSYEGFLPAIRQMAEEITGIYNIDCSVEIHEEMPSFDELTMRHIYYIVSEAINNAVKHSCAARIIVALLKEGGKLAMIVRDNGKGYGEANNSGDGLGLRIMKYRADIIGIELKIESASTGTSVTCILNEQYS